MMDASPGGLADLGLYLMMLVVFVAGIAGCGVLAYKLSTIYEGIRGDALRPGEPEVAFLILFGTTVFTLGAVLWWFG